MKYGVLYGLSGGYLPTSHAGPFDTREEAAEYIVNEYDRALDGEWDTRSGENPPPKELTVSEVEYAGLALDPTNEACYWSMVRLTDDEAKEWEESDGY